MSEEPKKQHLAFEQSLVDEFSSSEEKQYDHVFQDPKLLAYYTDIYEEHKYECRHHLDPDFTWTVEEERKVVWKNDYYVTFWAIVMFTALNFDRNNLNQALSTNFLKDLKLTTNQLNLGHTINLVCFLSSELPSQLISKKLGADIWIPSQMVLWSIVSISQIAIRDARGFYVTRALLGLCQGGFICDVCLWMSYFYTNKEFPMRISLFYISNPLTTVWSSLLAFALLKISTPSLKQNWKWLFLVEGLFTLIIGVLSFFKMPASPVQTKAWYRKKGWYTDREEKIVVNRVLRDDPLKGDMHNREPVGPWELFTVLKDYDLYPIYAIRILGDIGATPVTNYLQIILRKLGFSTFQTNALTIPYAILSTIMMLTLSHASELFNTRSFALLLNPVWIGTCLIALRYWPRAQIDVWGTYALITVLLSASPYWPLSISWCSSNSNSVRARAVLAALVNIFSQTGGIISANIYRTDDAPKYHRGNTQLIGIAFGCIGAIIFARLYYPFRNRQKQAAWDKLTEEEQEHYPKTTTDEGNKRLDFRFVY